MVVVNLPRALPLLGSRRSSVVLIERGRFQMCWLLLLLRLRLRLRRRRRRRLLLLLLLLLRLRLRLLLLLSGMWLRTG
jgi:hypothetical protein